QKGSRMSLENDPSCVRTASRYKSLCKSRTASVSSSRLTAADLISSSPFCPPDPPGRRSISIVSLFQVSFVRGPELHMMDYNRRACLFLKQLRYLITYRQRLLRLCARSPIRTI